MAELKKAVNPDPPKKLKDYPLVVTPFQASQILRVSPNAIYEMLHMGTIQFFKIGSHYKIPKMKLALMFGLITDEDKQQD